MQQAEAMVLSPVRSRRQGRQRPEELVGVGNSLCFVFEVLLLHAWSELMLIPQVWQRLNHARANSIFISCVEYAAPLRGWLEGSCELVWPQERLATCMGGIRRSEAELRVADRDLREAQGKGDARRVVASSRHNVRRQALRAWTIWMRVTRRHDGIVCALLKWRALCISECSPPAQTYAHSRVLRWKQPRPSGTKCGGPISAPGSSPRSLPCGVQSFRSRISSRDCTAVIHRQIVFCLRFSSNISIML